MEQPSPQQRQYGGIWNQIQQYLFIINRNLMGKIVGMGSNARHLATPDEVRRSSGENIFAFIGGKLPVFLSKEALLYLERLGVVVLMYDARSFRLMMASFIIAQ